MDPPGWKYSGVSTPAELDSFTAPQDWKHRDPDGYTGSDTVLMSDLIVELRPLARRVYQHAGQLD